MQPNLFLCNTLRKAKYHYRHFLNFKQILSKSIENFCSHKNLNINVYNSFIYNCQNLEATGMSSVCGWISNLWSVQTMGYYLAPKSNELSSQEKTGDEMHNSKRKMPIWKSCILYGTDHVTFWKSQKHGDKKRCVAVRSQGKGRDEYKEHRGLLGQETTLHDTTVVDKVIARLSTSTECTTLTVNPDINYGLWVMKCQCWFTGGGRGGCC